ncbi:MAG: EAL domain-containing protein [Gammaproteobacteria bacterium]|jgi:diguanylate cyclase (GGDEF)-like protein
MLFPSLYEELGIERYATMAQDMLPECNVFIALCDDGGQIVWANSDDDAQKNRIGDYREWASTAVTSRGSECIKYHQAGVSIGCCLLGELAGRSAGDLVFYEIDDEAGNTAVSERTMQVLNNIASLVKVELQHLYELNAMASELGERYDELAMLRASDLELAEQRESRHILSRYIRSCGEHLEADYAAIWVPARHAIFPGGTAYTHDSLEMMTLLQQLCSSALTMFQSGHEGFGINDKDEDLRRAIHLPADKKVLLVPVLDATGSPCGVLCCLNEFYSKDFTNSNKSTLDAVARKTLKYLQDTQDELTGLLNRKGFEESVWRDIYHARSERHLVLLNIDQFSVVNAAYGVATGDLVLQAVAEKISICSHRIRHMARLEADLFAMVIESRGKDIESLVRAICDEVDRASIAVKGKKVSIQSRAGVIAFNSKETALSDHIYAAEIALDSAKEEAKSRVVVYKPGNTALLKRKKQLTQVENIKHALRENRFELYCQRIEPLTGNETHYEILVRMIDEAGQLVPPNEFIPVAERYNLMGMVDRWVFKRAMQLLSSDDYREHSTLFKWGINISGMTISDDDFHDYVSGCLHEYSFLPTNLYFEITETSAIKNFKNCITFMNEIHSMGVQFALDDFGSGLSSFSYLKKLSLDYLKIDGGLIRDIVSSRLDQTMVRSISEIANVMGVQTIAEFVENEAILEKLATMKIDYAQGYEIMLPQPMELELKHLCELSSFKVRSGS